jgi:hypothetical protein
MKTENHPMETVSLNQEQYLDSLCDDNIGINLMEIVWEGADWMHLAKDRDRWRALVNTVMNLRVP